MQGQLPLSVEGLGSQGVEQFGRSAALFPSLHHHLFFPHSIAFSGNALSPSRLS